MSEREIKVWCEPVFVKIPICRGGLQVPEILRSEEDCPTVPVISGSIGDIHCNED